MADYSVNIASTLEPLATAASIEVIKPTEVSVDSTLEPLGPGVVMGYLHDSTPDLYTYLTDDGFLDGRWLLDGAVTLGQTSGVLVVSRNTGTLTLVQTSNPEAMRIRAQKKLGVRVVAAAASEANWYILTEPVGGRNEAGRLLVYERTVDFTEVASITLGVQERGVHVLAVDPTERFVCLGRESGRLEFYTTEGELFDALETGLYKPQIAVGQTRRRGGNHLGAGYTETARTVLFVFSETEAQGQTVEYCQIAPEGETSLYTLGVVSTWPATHQQRVISACKDLQILSQAGSGLIRTADTALGAVQKFDVTDERAPALAARQRNPDVGLQNIGQRELLTPRRLFAEDPRSGSATNFGGLYFPRWRRRRHRQL